MVGLPRGQVYGMRVSARAETSCSACSCVSFSAAPAAARQAAEEKVEQQDRGGGEGRG